MNLPAPSPYDDWGTTIYPSMSPMVQLHARRLWTSGTFSDNSQIVSKICTLDKRVGKRDVQEYLEDHRHGDDWVQERRRNLLDQYEKLQKDQSLLSSHVDETYDVKVFEPLRRMVEYKVEGYAKDLYEYAPTGEDDDKGCPVSEKTLESLTGTAVKLHQAQRLARGMQDKGGAMIVKVSDIEGNPQVAKVLEAQVEKICEEVEDVVEETALEEI